MYINSFCTGDNNIEKAFVTEVVRRTTILVCNYAAINIHILSCYAIYRPESTTNISN